MSRRINGALLALTLLLIGAGMLVLNVHTPLMMDDYDYSFSWATGERLAGAADVIASQAAHYRLWGGRSVAHTLAQLFLYWGKPVFNLANTAMYLLLLLEIAALARRRGQEIRWWTPLAAHMLLLTLPFFGTVFLWLDGACNYLWCTALALLPLLVARSEREGGWFDAGFAHGWLALPLCFLAGWTNENTACGVLAALLLLLVWDVYRGRTVRFWRVAALAAQALGVAVLLLAPGNFVRTGAESGRGLLLELAYRFAVTSYCLLRYAGIPAALTLLLLWRRRGKVACGEGLCLLGAAALLSAYALVGSPQISDRSFTAVAVLTIAALLMAAQDGGKGLTRRSGVCAAVLLAGCAAGVMVFAVWDVREQEMTWRTQMDAMEAAAAAGETDVTVASVPKRSRFTMAILLENDPQAWPNSTLSRYYGVRIHGGAAADGGKQGTSGTNL